MLEKFQLSPSASILIAGIVIAEAILLTHFITPADAANYDPTTQGALVPVPTAEDHIVGSLNAPIVLIEYADFQCPYCSLVYPTLKRIVEEGNGQVAWVYRNFPLDSIHPEARPAALAAECVADELGNEAYWKFMDTIYNNQDKISGVYYNTVALGLGAKFSTFSQCVSSKKFNDKLDSESADAYGAGGQGTPFTIVYSKGKQKAISGALPYAQFEAVIKSI